MIRSILVPLDGSRFAEAVLGVAVRLARLANAELRLVTVHQPEILMVPIADIPVSTASGEEELRTHQQTHLAEVALGLGTVGPSPVTTEVIDGLAGPTLAGWVERNTPDLVVMSTHGRGPLSRFWLGSIADHLIRHVSVPVLLVRPHDGDPPVIDPGNLGFKSALVPVDLSDESETILQPLGEFAKLMGTEITLIHVIEPIMGVYGGVPSFPAPMSADLIEAARSRAQQHLDRLAGQLTASGFQVGTKVYFSMGVAGTLLRQMAEGHHDLIALTTHGASGFRRLLMGSVADKLIRGSERPVLILRPQSLPNG